MRRIHIVGRKNHGKTALTAALAAELSGRGLAVGTIKHAGHPHEIDAPGTDSHRHRLAGGWPAAVVTPALVGAFLTRGAGDDPYAMLAPLYRGCDLVLIEGDHEAGGGVKIEVWRAAAGTEPLARSRADIVAVVTDDPVEVPVPVWPRSKVAWVAERVRALVHL